MLRASEEWIQESCSADVVAELPVLEKNVHRFPQCVVQELDELLKLEGIGGGIDYRIRRARTGATGHRESHRASLTRPVECRGHLRVAVGRTETHDHVLRTHDRLEPRTEQRREIERWQRALSHDHGMDEFHGHVLRVGRIGSAPEGQ